LKEFPVEGWGQAVVANQWATYAVNAGTGQWAPNNAAPLPGAAVNQPEAIIQEVGPRALFQQPVNPVPGIDQAAEQLRPMDEPQANVFHPDPVNNDVEDWENYGYAERLARAAQNPEQVPALPAANPVQPLPVNDQRENAIRRLGPEMGGENIARRVLEQLEREGFNQVRAGDIEEQHFDRALDRAEELMIQYRNEDRNGGSNE